MTLSSKSYPTDGTKTDFPLGFNYLDRSHVYVSVDNTPTTDPASIYVFTWVNSTTIRVLSIVDDTPIPSGSVIRISRSTPIDSPAVVFGGGASLSSENLNKNSLYLTYALQEATDQNQEFTKLYLGSSDKEPKYDNEGDALQAGAVYFNTVEGKLFFWSGSKWLMGDQLVEVSKARDETLQALDEVVDRLQDATDASASAQASAATALASEIVALSARTAAIDARDTAVQAQAVTTVARNEAVSAASIFSSSFLGPKAVYPSLDNEGNTLNEGTLFWKTGSGAGLYSWDGSSWVSAPQGPKGDPGEDAILPTGIVTTDSNQTLTNKTIGDTLKFSWGEISSASGNRVTITPKDANGNLLTNSQLYFAQADGKWFSEVGFDSADGWLGDLPVSGFVSATGFLKGTSVVSGTRLQSFGAMFNVLDYIADEVGGEAQVTKIINGDLSQDMDIVTSGCKKAFTAFAESGASGFVAFPAGSYRINDELTSGVMNSGDTVAQWINSAGLNLDGPTLEQRFAVKGQGWATQLYVDETFSSSEQAAGNFIDKCVIRFEQDSKRETGPDVHGLTFYWLGNRDNRWKCPTALKITNSNFSSISDIVVRGENYEWPGRGVHLENINNSWIKNIRLKAGQTPLMFDIWQDGSADTVSIVNNGSRLSAADMFSNSANMTDADWSNKFFMIGRGSSSTADGRLIKVRQKISDSVLEIDPAWTGPNASDVLISSERPRAAMNTGDNLLLFKTPVLASDMDGMMITVTRVGDTDNSSKGNLTAYIKPGSIYANGKGCRLVTADGVTPANAVTGRSQSVVLFSTPWFLGQSSGNFDGNNNEINIENLMIEKHRGGAAAIWEQCQDVHLRGTKFHCRDMFGSGDQEQEFTACGELGIFDSCNFITMTDCTFTWPSGIDPNNEYASAFSAYGEDNYIVVDDYKMYGTVDVMRYWNFSPAEGPNQRIELGNGLMNTSYWGHASNDQDLVSVGSSGGFKSVHNLVGVHGTCINRDTGSGVGPQDLLVPYVLAKRVQGRAISDGSITIQPNEGRVIVYLSTQNGASTDDLFTILGGFDGQEILLRTASSSQDVVVKNGSPGNIQTSSAVDISLLQVRDGLSLTFAGGYWRQAAAASI